MTSWFWPVNPPCFIVKSRHKHHFFLLKFVFWCWDRHVWAIYVWWSSTAGDGPSWQLTWRPPQALPHLAEVNDLLRSEVPGKWAWLEWDQMLVVASMKFWEHGVQLFSCSWGSIFRHIPFLQPQSRTIAGHSYHSSSLIALLVGQYPQGYAVVSGCFTELPWTSQDYPHDLHL